MGIGVFTNPVVVGYALIVFLKEIGVIDVDLLIPSIIMAIVYTFLTYVSLHT